MNRTVVWFSCGAASTIAAKLTLAQRENVVIAYCDTSSEDDDTARYLADCQDWFGQEIVILHSTKYADVDDVIDRTRYINGPDGARCTGELKKALRHQFQQPDDEQVFGFNSSRYTGRVPRLPSTLISSAQQVAPISRSCRARRANTSGYTTRTRFQ